MAGMPSSVVAVVATLLLLLAFCEASSSPRQHLQLRKMLDVRNMLDCSDPTELVKVYQGRDESQQGGMPSYTVEITNECVDCPGAVCAVHLSCGDFANTELVDPAKFRRLAVDDCLVNNGGPIAPGDMISFQYDNSFLYPMTVKSATCNCS